MAKGKKRAPVKSKPKASQPSKAATSKSSGVDAEAAVKSKSAERTKSTAAVSTADMPFGRINYILMVAGILIMFLGYVLMAGGGTDDPNEFNPAIFGFQRITLAPLIILLGIAVEIYAILKKSD